MNKNVSNPDRFIRTLVAVMLLVGTALHMIPGFWAILAWFFAGVFILTAIVGTCPLYSIFGLSSCPKKKPAA
jgi:hypothetical protein